MRVSACGLRGNVKVWGRAELFAVAELLVYTVVVTSQLQLVRVEVMPTTLLS